MNLFKHEIKKEETFYYDGFPLSELNRAELEAAVGHLGLENQRLRKDTGDMKYIKDHLEEAKESIENTLDGIRWPV